MFMARGNNLISDNLKTAVENAGKPITISAAESITGGLISSIITDTPGSSSFFNGSDSILFRYQQKRRYLGIDSGIIKSKGAVSREVCGIMADNVRTLFNTDYSLSVTGFAGPEYEGDNLGLVFCCITGPSGYSKVFEKSFWEQDRDKIQDYPVCFK